MPSPDASTKEVTIDISSTGKHSEKNGTAHGLTVSTVALGLGFVMLVSLGVAIGALVVGVSLASRIDTLEAHISEVRISTSSVPPAGFAGGTSALTTAAGEWAPGVHMPSERSDMQAIACAGAIVLIGG